MANVFNVENLDTERKIADDLRDTEKMSDLE